MVHHTSREPVLWGWVCLEIQELHILCTFVPQSGGSVCASRPGQKLWGVSSYCFTRKNTQPLTLCGHYLVSWKSELWNLTGGVVSLGLGSFEGIQRRDAAIVGTLGGISSRMLSVLPQKGLAPTVSLPVLAEIGAPHTWSSPIMTSQCCMTYAMKMPLLSIPKNDLSYSSLIQSYQLRLDHSVL